MVDISDEIGGILSRDSLIALNSYWRIRVFEYDSTDNLIYMGCNQKIYSATSDNTWAIWKFSYTGTNMTGIQGPITGIWDNRVTLDWA